MNLGKKDAFNIYFRAKHVQKENSQQFLRDCVLYPMTCDRDVFATH